MDSMIKNNNDRIVDKVSDLSDQLPLNVVEEVYSNVVLDMVKNTSLKKFLKPQKDVCNKTDVGLSQKDKGSRKD